MKRSVQREERARQGCWRFSRGSEENLNDGADGEQSLRLDGRKIWWINQADVSQTESNNIKACVLPSIHLPLTREARVVVQGKGWCGF